MGLAALLGPAEPLPPFPGARRVRLLLMLGLGVGVLSAPLMLGLGVVVPAALLDERCGDAAVGSQTALDFRRTPAVVSRCSAATMRASRRMEAARR